MKLSAMKLPSLRDTATEARLLLIGIPVLIWTLIPIYHMFVFAISPKEDAFAGKFWPDHPTLHNFHIVFYQQHYFLRDFWLQFWNSLVIAVSVGALTLLIATAAAFSISRLRRTCSRQRPSTAPAGGRNSASSPGRRCARSISPARCFR